MSVDTFHKELLPLIITTIAMAGLEFTGLHKFQWWVFWLFLISILIIAFNYVSGAIEDICQHLGIYCFSQKKRPKKE